MKNGEERKRKRKRTRRKVGNVDGSRGEKDKEVIKERGLIMWKRWREKSLRV